MSNSVNSMGTQTAASTAGSRTILVRPSPASRPLSAPSGTLRLRAEPTEQRHIQWADDVIDNEGMGKKSSKVCCIYHKPRAVDESSDESSTDSSDSDSESEPDNSMARPVGGNKATRRGRPRHNHDHNHDHRHGNDPSDTPQEQVNPRRRLSPNAYEKMPKAQK